MRGVEWEDDGICEAQHDQGKTLQRGVESEVQKQNPQ